MRRGTVSLVGAGPGDPDLLTRRAIGRLLAAEVVFHDGLVPGDIVRLAPHAMHRSVARRAGRHELTQSDVTTAVIDAAHAGMRVVRLKSGDPFVLGRGGEEAIALHEAGIPYDVVPGISSALAAPLLAGIPLTHRGVSSAFVVLSGHDARAYLPAIDGLAPGSLTVVVLMGLRNRRDIGHALMTRGWKPDTPAAIVMSASQPGQSMWTGQLASIGSASVDPGFDSPGVIVIGAVAGLDLRSSIHPLTHPPIHPFEEPYVSVP